MPLNKRNFAIAVLASTDEDASIALRSIRVTPEGTEVTDGHCAAIVSAFESDQPLLFADADGIEPAEHWTPFLLERGAALSVAKSIPKKKKNTSVTDKSQFAVVDATTEDNERAMISVTDIQRQDIIRTHKPDATYPDIAKLVPSNRSARLSVRMDATHLAQLINALAGFSKAHGNAFVTMTSHGPGKPLKFFIKGKGQEMVAIIMPGSTEECGTSEYSVV